MAGEWREVTLDQLGRIVTGKTPSSSRPDYFGGEIPFVTPTDFDGRRIIETTGRYLTESGADAVGARIPARAVMVSCIGSDMGKVAVAGRDCVTNQQINSIIVTCRDDPLFVYYNLSMRKAEIRGMASGSAQPILNKSAFGRLEILLPPPDEQRAIAHILGTLDDKIEVNRRMSETLEAMARSLFKSWFVDFDPVRAKMQGRWRKGKFLPGLPAHLYDLFPDRLVDSELGEIPEGWGMGTLGDLSVLNPEVWTRQTRPPEIKYVDLSNTKWGRIEVITTHQASDAPSRAQRVLRAGDTIVGTVRPGNGSYAFISEPGLTGSTGFAVLRPTGAEYAEFVYLAATTADNIDTLAHLADGAAYPAVRPEVVAATPIVRSSDEVLGRFSEVAGSLLARIARSDRESRTLAALRDVLLRKLISGELRVKVVERFVKERGL
jgi:type I restriction enzyme S subunit